MESVQKRSTRAPPMAGHQAAALPPRRFNFRPSDHDLITLVLRPMVARRQQSFDDGGGFIHLADVYSVAPERIAERYAPAPGGDGGDTTWYFLCPARCRYKAAAAGAPGEGRWDSDTGGEVRPVRGADGRRVGHSRTLSYGARTAAPWTTVTRHGWCMVELALDEPAGGGSGDHVLCKVFRSPRAAAAPVSKRNAVGQHPEAPPSVRQHCWSVVNA